MLGPQGRLLWLPGVAIWTIFEFLGEAGDVNNSTSMPNHQDEPYRDLGLCVNKVLSAWTEVWSGSCRTRTSIMATEGRSGQIFTFLSFWARLVMSITRQVCTTTEMDHIATLVYV